MSMNPRAFPALNSTKRTTQGRYKAACSNCSEPITQLDDLISGNKVWIHDISHKKDCEF